MCKPIKLESAKTVIDPGEAKLFLMRDFLQQLHNKYRNAGSLTFFLHSYPVKFDYDSSDETTEVYNRWHLEALRTFDLFDPEDDINWLATYDAYVNNNNNVPPGWEKGVSNQITIGQDRLFIPMFDMKGNFYNSPDQLANAFGPFFRLSGYQNLAHVFSTGNSYRVYVPVVLTLEHWRELLIDTLATEPAEFTVDKRWLGRVLETDGLTAMRISANTVSKRQVPYRVYPQL